VTRSDPYQDWWGRRVPQHELDTAHAHLADIEAQHLLSLAVRRQESIDRWEQKFRSAVVENHLNHLTEARRDAHPREA
jgi:hypothetical protein